MVKQKLTTIRNRCNYYLENKNLPVNQFYTWANCLDRSRNKLKYRFNDWLEEKVEEDIWISTIAFIKFRLKQKYDDEYAWRYTEYSIIEKMNKQDFYRIEPYSSVLNHIAIQKAGRANKIWNKRPNSRKRTSNFDWADVLLISKTRIKKYKIQENSVSDELWYVCYFANFEKIRSQYRWLNSWETCILRNHKKLEKRE